MIQTILSYLYLTTFLYLNLKFCHFLNELLLLYYEIYLEVTCSEIHIKVHFLIIIFFFSCIAK